MASLAETTKYLNIFTSNDEEKIFYDLVLTYIILNQAKFSDNNGDFGFVKI